jgi:hypothetical protein
VTSVAQYLNLIQRAPSLVFLLTALVLWLSTRLGILVGKRVRPLKEFERRDVDLIVGAAVTLLGLIIGFSFSLASSRFEQRKDYEEEEANAIGTEYLRVGILPAADAAEVRALMKHYLDQRVLFYRTRTEEKLAELDQDTAKSQSQMWAIVERAAATSPSPVTALIASGMNDVINTQGYTQAAWWNRLPEGAWILMVLLAIGASVLVGYSSHSPRRHFLLVLPFLISVAFFLIADIDAPRHGMIRVSPHNLEALAKSLIQP